MAGEGKMKYFISTGEHSGDMHGATLVREIKKLDPEAEFRGMGGPLMAGEGVRVLFDPTRHSTIGFWEAIKHLLRFRRLLSVYTRVLKEYRPDVFIWLDFGGFNLLLAERAKRLSIPVACLFSPSAWAYGKKRAVRMAECVSHLAAVFPFEADFYRRFGLKVTYIGHPLLDRVKTAVSREKWRRAQGIDDGEKVVVLMPGSRQQEIRNLLPVMLAAAEKLQAEHKEVKFYLPLASTVEKTQLNSFLTGFSGRINVVDNNVYPLLAAADLGVLSSGTATLEAAISGLPVVVVYRISRPSAFVYRRLRNKESRGREVSIALPNLIAGQKILPELLQNDLTPDNLTDKMKELLKENARAAIKAEYEKIRKQLGPPGVMERAARVVTAEAQIAHK